MRDALLLGPPVAAGAFLVGVSLWACFLNLTDVMSSQPWVLRVASVAGPASLGLGLLKIAADLAKVRDDSLRRAVRLLDERLADVQGRLAAIQAAVGAAGGRAQGGPAVPGSPEPGRVPSRETTS